MSAEPIGTLKTSQRANLVSLFTSGSTLLCCALPALLVTLGAGAALSSLISVVPQLVWVSEHKPLVFGVAGGMLLLAGILQWQARNAPCPTDSALAAICAKTRKNSLRVYWFSVGIFAIGAWFAFVAPLLV
ncbi:MAG: hypothetical protein ACKVN9_07645 [Methylophilaceae bacterium]